MKVFKEHKVGDTIINVSGHNIEVSIYRNASGNLEVYGINDLDLFPEGTCTEGCNEEVIFTKFVP